ALTPDTSLFLNRKSPAYAGGAVEFLLSDHLTSAFKHLADAVRKGGTAEPQQGSITPEHPMWLTFARTMGGMMVPAAAGLAELLPLDSTRPCQSARCGGQPRRLGDRFRQEKSAGSSRRPRL